MKDALQDEGVPTLPATNERYKTKDAALDAVRYLAARVVAPRR